jgi:hypothetical protein
MAGAIVFDFDGVLAIPYSQPEVLFAGTEALLRSLHAQGHVLAVASFNPRAYHVLRPLIDEGVISAVRAGSCVKWWAEGDGTYSDDVHRKNMRKSAHIQSMLDNEWRYKSLQSLVFIDDDLANIDEVDRAVIGPNQFPVLTHHVPSYAGAGPATLREVLLRAKTAADEFSFKWRRDIMLKITEIMGPMGGVPRRAFSRKETTTATLDLYRQQLENIPNAAGVPTRSEILARRKTKEEARKAKAVDREMEMSVGVPTREELLYHHQVKDMVQLMREMPDDDFKVAEEDDDALSYFMS